MLDGCLLIARPEKSNGAMASRLTIRQEVGISEVARFYPLQVWLDLVVECGGYLIIGAAGKSQPTVLGPDWLHVFAKVWFRYTGIY